MVNHSKINVSVYNDGHSQVCSSKKTGKNYGTVKIDEQYCLSGKIHQDGLFLYKSLNPKIHKEIINPRQARLVFIGFESYLNCNVVFALENYNKDRFTVH